MKQLPLLKKAREEGKAAYFRHTRLIIKNNLARESSLSTIATGPTPRDGGSTTRSSGEDILSALGGSACSAEREVSKTDASLSGAEHGKVSGGHSVDACALLSPAAAAGGDLGASSLLPPAGAGGVLTESSDGSGSTAADIVAGRSLMSLRDRRK